MKKNNGHKTTLMGTGGGAVLFVLFGILPGIYLGGLTGLSAAGMLFGTSVYADIFKSLLAAAGMMIGITFGGVLFIGAGSILGWLADMIAFRQNAKKSGRRPCNGTSDNKSTGGGLTPHHAG